MNKQKERRNTALLALSLMLLMIALTLGFCWLDFAEDTPPRGTPTARATAVLPPSQTPTPMMYQEYDIVAYSTVVNPPGGRIWEKHHPLNSAWLGGKITGYVHNSAPAIVLSTGHHDLTRAYYNSWRTREGVTTVNTARLDQIIALCEGQLDLTQVPNSVRLAYYIRFRAYVTAPGRTPSPDLLIEVDKLIAKYRP
jgi:HNH/Endo VII superfamily toxin with a SHH signature